MTREEAIDAVHRAALVRPELIDALTTLAPAVRYEPPTVDEVGDEEKCWVSFYDDEWEAVIGRSARDAWNGRLLAWLPYSAIPEGGA